jgi:hypothetical protein
MQLELPRTGLNGSALVELLAQLALSDNPSSPPSFVEGLGRWLGWKEAIQLSAVLSAAAPAAPRAPAGMAPSRQAGALALAKLDAEFTRVRTALALAITQALDEANAGHDGHALQDSPDFLPWRRCCLRLQQAMEAAVGPLRAQARAVLQAQAALQPGLATLAALDAALATALAPHEQAQLALMPVLLERHFRRQYMRQNMRQNMRQGQPQDGAPGAFRHDMQRLLQAELELRLQPALGLLDALRSAHTGSR